jgi:hypothetical protein
MRKIIFLTLAMIIGYFVNGQDLKKTDTILKLSNESIICNVTNVSELEITYSYVGETMTNTISKKQVKEIRFGSGRVQKISEVVKINGEEDWEKVQLTTIQSDVLGLTKKGEVKGKSMGTAMANMSKVKTRAEEQLKKEAAKLGAHHST